MRDLAGQMAEDSGGLACLDVRGGEARLLLMKAGEIYLSRQLNTEIDQSQMAGEAWASTFQRLLVELQRSFDYFENQMGQGQILRLLLAPVPGITNQLIEQLNINLVAEGSVMDLNVLWNTGSILSARINMIVSLQAALRLLGLPHEPAHQFLHGLVQAKG